MRHTLAVIVGTSVMALGAASCTGNVDPSKDPDPAELLSSVKSYYDVPASRRPPGKLSCITDPATRYAEDDGPEGRIYSCKFTTPQELWWVCVDVPLSEPLKVRGELHRTRWLRSQHTDPTRHPACPG